MRSFDLGQLLCPVTIEEFIGTRYEKTLLHVSRGGNADYYSNLFSLDAVDEFLHVVKPAYTKAFALDSRRKIEVAEYSAADGLADPLRLFDLYDSGATIVLKEIEGHCPSLQALCRSAEKRSSFPFVATAFLSPPQGQCFPIHFDAKDIFVTQISGSKNWRFFRPQYELPLSHQHCYDGMAEQDFLEEVDLASWRFFVFSSRLSAPGSSFHGHVPPPPQWPGNPGGPGHGVHGLVVHPGPINGVVITPER